MSAADRSGLRPGLLLGEVSLLLVHLAVVVGFARLYDGTSPMADLATFVLVAHVLAMGIRRLRVPVPIGVVVSLGGALLVATWLLFPDTTAAGLPTAATIDEARAAIDLAAHEFKTVAAPTAPLVGFQLLAGLALWAAVFFADWAAFRLRATAEALAPATIIFIFCSVLSRGDHRFLVAVLFVGAVILFVANHRAHVAEMDNAWLSTSPVEGARWVRRAALSAGVVIVAAGAVVAPLVPGFDDEAVVTWRNRSAQGGLRTTVSPIVDLRRRLVTQSNREMFEVQANQPSYWRLTSLHEFDGKIWSSGGEYGKAEDRLPSSLGPIASTEAITQTVRIQGLSAIWVPAAFEARTLSDATRGLSWDPDSSTLIVDAESENSNGLRYVLTSERPVLDPATLESVRGVDPDDVVERYLGLPADFPDLATTEALKATAGATTRYAQARALQDYFRDGSFIYNTEIDPGHGNRALEAFLEAREGYCEQFSGAYAAMARSLGIPARVAVGFTQGERDPDDPTMFRVRGVHAHAWPEVYFPEIGWVPFEPTPSRGMPGAEAYTGVTPQQDESSGTPPPSSAVTTSTTASTPAQGPTTSAAPRPEVPVRGTTIKSSETDDVNRWLRVGSWVLGLGAAWVLVLLVAPRIRAAGNRRSGTSGAVLNAWEETLGPIRWATGVRPRSSEGHAEFARRAGSVLDQAAEPFEELAHLSERAAWAAAPVHGSDAARAVELATRVRTVLHDRESFIHRVRRRLSWREAFGIIDTPGNGRADTHDSASTTDQAASDVALDREREPVG